MRILKKIGSFIRTVVEEYITGIAFMVMLLTMIYGVLMRYVFNNPLAWGIEVQSVCFVYMGRVIGIGAGQQNRVDCIRIAGEKARQWLVRHKLSQDTKLTLISDAFLPFVDNVEVANEYNVKYILQPGGSIKDADIDTMCQKYDIQMILSNQRIFTH